MIHVVHAVPRDDVLLGIVRAEHLATKRAPADLDRRVSRAIERRSAGLRDEEEARRVAVRDMLRNGSYRPTGRGKPASEYLLRAAAEEAYTFPRINGPVDICNLLSLEHIIPVSLWDLDRTPARHFVFRLGRPGEGYVFNRAGQRMDVEDLVVGCRVQENAEQTETPIVNPVRDSLATKTTPDTSRVAVCIYAPAGVFTTASLSEVCRECAELLAECGDRTQVSLGVVPPESTREI